MNSYPATASNPYHLIVLSSTLSFEHDSGSFAVLKEHLLKANPKFPIQIQVDDPSLLDIQHFANFIDFLATQPMTYRVNIVAQNHVFVSQNELLTALYLHRARKEESAPIISHIKTHPASVSKKVRRSKQMSNKGLALQVQTQQQQHQQSTQATSVNQQAQNQNQQQLSQTKAHQIQSQQQRVQQLQQESTPIDVASLGLLIHEGNLDQLVDEGFSLDEAKTFWFEVVGKYASKVKDARNRITHIPAATLRKMRAYREQFRDGIHVENLPNGFGFTIREREEDGKSIQESIVFFDAKLVRPEDERKDTPLSARFTSTLSKQEWGNVGQFYPFSLPFQQQDYQQFIKQQQPIFETLLSASKSQDRRQALIKLCQLEKPGLDVASLLDELFPTHDETLDLKTVQGLQSILLAKGTETLHLFLTKLHALKQIDQFEQVKNLFLSHNPDWRALVSNQKTRPTELSALECLDALLTMSPQQSNWWVAMTNQHAKANTPPFELVDLVNAHQYFFDQVKAIDTQIQLPFTCPIKEIKNMKTVYDRILYVLKKAIDPPEQAKHLDKLDFGMQGVICASRGSYVFVSHEMELKPENELFDWEKFRKYAPLTPMDGDGAHLGDVVVGHRVVAGGLEPIVVELPNFTSIGLKRGYQKNYPGHVSDFDTSEELHFPTIPARVVYRGKVDWFVETFYVGSPWFQIGLVKEGNKLYRKLVVLQESRYVKKNFDPNAKGIRKVYAKATINDQPEGHTATDESNRDLLRVEFYRLSADPATKKIKEALQEGLDSNKLICKGNIYYHSKAYYAEFAQYPVSFGTQTIYEHQLTKFIRLFPVKSPELQDELLMFQDILAYDITLDRLLFFAKEFKFATSLTKYFYRYIGTQAFTYPYSSYTMLLQKVLTSGLDNAQQKAMIPLLAITTTGMRAIKTEQNIEEEVLPCLALLKSWNFPLADFTKALPAHLLPTLPELYAMLMLEKHQPQSSESPNWIYPKILELASAHGETVYLAITNLSQAINTFKKEALFALWLKKIQTIDDLNSTQKNVLILLSSIMDFDDRTENFASLIASIPEETLAHVEAVLKQCDLTQSKALIDEPTLLAYFKRLKATSIDCANDYAYIAGLTQHSFPSLTFKDQSTAKATVFLIQDLLPLVDNLKAILEINPQFLDDLGPFASLAKDFKDWLVAFQKRLAEHIEPLTPLIDTLKTGNTTVIPEILKQLQAVLTVVENPFQGGSIALQMKAAPFVATIKLAFKSIIEHFNTLVQLKLVEHLNTLKLQNEPLTLRFKDLLVTQLPKLTGQALMLELNALLKQAEVFEAFLKRLKLLPQREALISMLEKQGYFAEVALIPIEPFTELLGYFVGKELNVVACCELILKARKNGMLLDMIQAKLALLAANEHLFSAEEFQTLLGLSLKPEAPLSEWIALQKHFHPNKAIFTELLRHAAQVDSVVLQKALSIKPEESPYITDYIKRYGVSSLTQLLTSLQEPTTARLCILHGACWTQVQEEDNKLPLDYQLQVLNKLNAESLQTLSELYKNRPCPRLSALDKAISAPNFKLTQFIHDYERDPFGRREQMLAQNTETGIDAFLAEITHLLDKTSLLAEEQNTLKIYARYILAIATEYGLSIDNHIKPVCDFSPKELQRYYNDCCQRTLENPEDVNAKLEALAILCETMFRTTGKYPYPSQIISVLSTVLFNDSILLEIPTGQGKSITLALIAAMTHGLSGAPMHTTVCSRNKLLTARDYAENLPFYRYLNIPTALVFSGEEQNVYDKPTVVYSTTADKSLYDSKFKIVHQITFPESAQQTVLCDEVDAEFFDNKNAFNFSEGNEDVFINPLEWLYPIVNDFIEMPLFKNEAFSEEEDIANLRAHLIEHHKKQYERHFERLTDYKINQLIDAAVRARQLVEKTHFLVRQKERLRHGSLETISEAHVIDLSSHAEDTEATLSYGVQQCLHARLNKAYAQQISKGMPKFSCDNQIDCVDSQNTHAFFAKFGRIIGCTGTAGTHEEIQEVQKALNIAHLLRIPPRRKGQLHMLSNIFADKEASFFFYEQTQIAHILRTLNKARHQPVLISCGTIPKAEQLFLALQQQFGDKVQIIHAENASDLKAFEQRVNKAKEAGIITITTPLGARGVDIKTKDNLLVIETELDRYRNRKQLHGRTARDANVGEVIGIFDINDIAHTHGVALKPLSRQDKLKALQTIMDKMDSEACFEREINLEVSQAVHHYQAILDSWFKEATPEEKPKILAAKAQLLDAAYIAWQTLLADSDPHGHYPNPYIRYHHKILDKKPVTQLVAKFKAQLEKTLFPASLTLFSQDKLSPIEAINKTKKTKTNTTPPKTLPLLNSKTDVYLNFAPQTQSTKAYQDMLKVEQTLAKQTAFWLGHNHKVDDATKTLASAHQKDFLKGLTSTPQLHLNWLKTLSNLELGKYKLKTLMSYLELSTLAFTDTVFLHQQTITTELNQQIAEESLSVIKKALKVLKPKHKKDQILLGQLHTQLETLKPNSCLMLQKNLLPLMQAIEEKLKSKTVKRYLQAVQQTLDTIGFNTTETQSADHKVGEHYLAGLMQIKARLEKRNHNAGFWKDKKHYEQKVKRFHFYIDQAKQLIEYKNKHNFPNIQSEILELQRRIRHDKVLYTSTARFFKLPCTVTLVHDINQLTQKCLKKPA